MSVLLQTSQKKALLRTLVEKVVLQRVATDKVRVRVVWRGGLDTTAEVRVPVSSFNRLTDAKVIVETVRRLTSQGRTDEQIATVLNANGHRTPWVAQFTAAAVQHVRLRNRIFRFPNKSRPRRKTGYLTLSQVADKLNVSSNKIYLRILQGKLTAKQDESSRCYLFPDKPSTLAQLRQLLDGKIEQLVL